MVLTAYFDESGTHAGSPLSAMSGFVGDARQWRKFEKRVGKLFKRKRVDVFHTIDVRRGDKDFEDWSVNEKIEFLDEFQHIINETLESAISAFIKADDHDWYKALPWPRKTRWDSKYGLLFRACLSQTIDVMEKIPTTKEHTLHVVLESGHANAQDVVRIYAWAKSRLGPSRALAGLIFESKKTCLPLAAADLFAYSALGQELGQKPIGIPKKPTKSDVSYRGNAWRIMLDRPTLRKLHEQAIRFAKERFSSKRRASED